MIVCLLVPFMVGNPVIGIGLCCYFSIVGFGVASGLDYGVLPLFYETNNVLLTIDKWAIEVVTSLVALLPGMESNFESNSWAKNSIGAASLNYFSLIIVVPAYLSLLFENGRTFWKKRLRFLGV